MENILPQKPGRIAVLFFLSLLLFILLYIGFSAGMRVGEAQILDYARQQKSRIERMVGKKIRRLKDRSLQIHRKLADGREEELSFSESEGVIFLRKGIIERYLGGIYHYEIRKSNEGDFYLTGKKKKVFFVRLLGEDVYYINLLIRLDDPPFLHTLPAGLYGTKLKYIPKAQVRETLTDKLDGMTRGSDRVYYYQSLLDGTNRQLLYTLELSRSLFRTYMNRQRTILFLALTGGFFLLQLFFALMIRSGSNQPLPLQRALFWVYLLGVGIPLFVILGYLDPHTLFFPVDGFRIQSIHQLLIMVLMIFMAISRVVKRFSPAPPTAAWLFLLSVIPVQPLLDRLFQSILIPYYRFELKIAYLSLLAVVLMILLLPYLFLRKIDRAHPPGLWIMLLSLTGVLALGFILGLDYRLIGLYLVLLLIHFPLGENKNRAGVMVIITVSVVMFMLVSKYQRMEKDNYITGSLRTVFISQNNYAKFIVRSIVNDIRSSNLNYPALFTDDQSRELEGIWQSSLAATENVPSGIFVISDRGDIINEYFYQMPYYGKEGITQLPFWCIEDRTVTVNNRRITYAVGMIKVISNSQYLGDIVIQVINSPELILRYQETGSIFLLNHRIDGRSISYIKFDSRGQVVENPGNIELDIRRGERNNWLDFSSANRTFRGYLFEDKGNTVVIYYPRSGIFFLLANYIKMLLFLFLIYSLANLGTIRRWNWKEYYYSFSLRVFVILILLSVLTGGLLSIFSVDFTSDLMNRNFQNELLKKGRIAQNIAFDMLSNDPEFSRRSLYDLSKIMNQAISLYRRMDHKYQQWDASNQRMIINNEIPIFLHSRVIRELENRNEKILLLEQEDQFNLFFRVRGYVFSIPVNVNRSIIYTQRNQYMDFITTLLFILVSFGVSAALFFRNKIMTPIHHLNNGMKEVEKGHLKSLKITPREIDLKRLYDRFNSMVEGIRIQREKISEMSRFKTLIKLGRRVAHEVKNPLTPIKLSAEQIQQSIADKNPGYEKLIKDSVEYIIDETEHLRKVSYGFLNLSKIDQLEKEWFDVSPFLKEQYLKFNLSYSQTDFAFEDRLGSRKVYWDRGKIEEILANFISNAVEAIPGGKKGRIRIMLCPGAENQVRLIIQDNGIGIDPYEIDDIFRENYSRKDLGSGLGLFISKRIVQMHGGKITITSKKNEGTRVAVILPVKC